MQPLNSRYRVSNPDSGNGGCGLDYSWPLSKKTTSHVLRAARGLCSTSTIGLALSIFYLSITPHSKSGMPFPFTFNLSVPGLSNPFSSAARSEQQLPPTPIDKLGSLQSQKQKIQITRPRPPLDSSAPPLLTPISRKRGWEPAFASTSQSTATRASTNGYLDTPAKYRSMAERSADEFHEVEMFADTGVF